MIKFLCNKSKLYFWIGDKSILQTCANFLSRFAYVVQTGTISSSTPPASHIPTITSNSKLIKSKQSKDDGVKRASVRRTTLGRSKLSRSPVKPIACTVSSITSTNPTITTTIANSLNSPAHVEEIIGPITRSRMCRFCPSPDDSSSEVNYKRGKRSLSNSRFHDKKNKLSRKNQTPIASSITGTTLTRKLRKETSLDSALADVASQEANENSSLSEAPPKETKSRPKKPTMRSASQKVLTTN